MCIQTQIYTYIYICGRCQVARNPPGKKPPGPGGFLPFATQVPWQETPRVRNPPGRNLPGRNLPGSALQTSPTTNQPTGEWGPNQRPLYIYVCIHAPAVTMAAVTMAVALAVWITIVILVLFVSLCLHLFDLFVCFISIVFTLAMSVCFVSW